MSIQGIGRSMLNNINRNNSLMNLYSKQISSGTRLVHAGVDPTATAINSKFESQRRGLLQAQKNVGMASDLMKVADSGLQNIGDMLSQIRELTLQAANDTNDSDERTAIGNQVGSIIDEIKATIGNTKYNGKTLLSSEDDISLYFQTGANAGQGFNATIGAISMEDLDALKTDAVCWGAEDVTGDEIASSTNLAALDDTQAVVNSGRSTLGSYINRMEHADRNLGTTIEAITESQSRIADVNEAEAEMNRSQAQLQMQASILMYGHLMDQNSMLLDLLM